MEQALIIDDNQLIHYAIAKAIHPYFPEVKAVWTEEDALREISSCFYSLCFLDIALSGLRGIPLVKKIQELSPDTKIVVMTEISLDDDMKKELDGCSFCFLAKPFEISELKAVARQAKSLGQTGGEWFAVKRMSERKGVDKTVNYSITVVELGKPISLSLKGDMIDMNESGIGLRTYYPLKPGCLLAFTNGLEESKYRTGIVKWSMPIDESDMYRVGIEFIKS